MENKKSKENSSIGSTVIIIFGIVALMLMSGVIGFMIGNRSSQSTIDLEYNVEKRNEEKPLTTDTLPETKVLSAGELILVPEYLDLEVGKPQSLQIQYDGIKGINAAKIVLDVPQNISIVSFDLNPKQNLIDLINSPEKAEIHIGRLEEGEIMPGAILLDVVIQAEECIPSGTIGFSNDIEVPDVNLTVSTFSFMMDCNE